MSPFRLRPQRWLRGGEEGQREVVQGVVGGGGGPKRRRERTGKAERK